MLSSKIFPNRIEAGKQLAENLLRLQGPKTLVLALPRGGVPVALEVAKVLRAPLDVFISRKLGAPGNLEFGIGAVAQGGVMILNKELVHALGISQEHLGKIVSKETAELQRRLNLFRGNFHNFQVKGKTVILVDDGLATGITALAAIRSLRLGSPEKLVLAVPVCAEDTALALSQEVDELVCLEQPENFYAVGQWYEDFSQLTDQDVLNLLEHAHRSIKI